MVYKVMALPFEIQEAIDSLQRQVSQLNADIKRYQDPSRPDIALARSLDDLGTVPACQLYRTTNQALAGITKITWTATAFDTGNGMADLTNNRINLKETGIYYVAAFTTLLVGATDEEAQMHIRAHSGSGAVFTIVGSSASTSTAMAAIMLNASTLWILDSQNLEGGSYVELYAGAPGNSLLAGSGQRPTLSVVKVADLSQFGAKIT